MCISLANSKIPLVGIGRLIPPHLLKVCSTHKDKAKIKCMGSVGGKTPTEPKLFSYFSNLRHIEHDKVDIMYIVLSYNMGDKIGKMSMNVVFKYIWQRG
jgi:hypothetical protein